MFTVDRITILDMNCPLALTHAYCSAQVPLLVLVCSGYVFTATRLLEVGGEEDGE